MWTFGWMAVGWTHGRIDNCELQFGLALCLVSVYLDALFVYKMTTYERGDKFILILLRATRRCLNRSLKI